MNGLKQSSHNFFTAVSVTVGLALCAAMACAQDNATPASTPQAVGAPSPVPRLIKFSGTIDPQITQNQTQASTPSRAIDVTFSLYELQEGGTPLWSESQKVQLDEQGHYTVLLGSSQPEGLPLDLFTSGKAQWLGVQPQLAGAVEQPRVLLVGMPYALKAADSDTLGGLPASAFLQAGAQASESAAVAATTRSASPGAQAATEQAPAAPSGSGTADYLPLWTNSTTLGNSVLFQSSTGSTAKVGLNTTTPASTLDVNGAGTVRGTLSLPATGTATASAGKNSQPASLQASAFNTSTSTAVKQTFNLQAEPTGNDTSSPSGKLNLLFASGTGTPAETGLSISSNGKITFASGQTFPGTGTITGVKAGTDLTGGGTSGSVTLNMDITKVPQLSAANTFSGNQSVTGNVSATKQLISTVATGTPPLSVNSTTQVPNLNASLLGGQPLSAFALLNAFNTFTNSNTMNGQLAVAGNGVYTYVGDPGCGPGWAGIEFNGYGGCNTYSIIGNGTDTLLNRPLGGAMRFRENNADEMTILPGGQVGIGTQTPGAQLEVDAPSTLSPLSAGSFLGGQSTGGFNSGGDGVIATGGYSSTQGGPGVDASGGGSVSGGSAGDGIDAWGGNFGQGGDGIYAHFGFGSPDGYAGYFLGDVHVTGAIYAGTKDFRIDHPLDPANKFLQHASVESSEMMNIYTSNVTTDAQGNAVVELPEWFESLNSDFRYQLTVIGQFAQAIVASEIANHHFSIKTDKPSVKVSWQVTGVRHDVFAQAHALQVEVDKPEEQRGYYIHPELYGAPEEKGIEWARHPEMMRRMKARQTKAPSQSTKP